MKQDIQKKNPSPHSKVSSNRKVQEVTVVKHYYTPQNRKRTGSIHDVKCHSNFPLPLPSRNMHLHHPVFKIVDSFLSSRSKTQPGFKGLVNKSANKAGSSLRSIYTTESKNDGNFNAESAKTYITKKLPVSVTSNCTPQRTVCASPMCTKRDRILTNMNNINNQNNVRVSLTDTRCKSQCGNATSEIVPKKTELGNRQDSSVSHSSYQKRSLLLSSNSLVEQPTAERRNWSGSRSYVEQSEPQPRPQRQHSFVSSSYVEQSQPQPKPHSQNTFVSSSYVEQSKPQLKPQRQHSFASSSYVEQSQPQPKSHSLNTFVSSSYIEQSKSQPKPQSQNSFASSSYVEQSKSQQKTQNAFTSTSCVDHSKSQHKSSCSVLNNYNEQLRAQQRSCTPRNTSFSKVNNIQMSPCSSVSHNCVVQRQISNFQNLRPHQEQQSVSISNNNLEQSRPQQRPNSSISYVEHLPNPTIAKCGHQMKTHQYPCSPRAVSTLKTSHLEQFKTQQRISPSHTNKYIEELKSEIRNSRTKAPSVSNTEDDYVSKLKEEILVGRAQCLEEARQVINELKNEILNYRLRPKSKYSSSCSDLTLNDKGQKTSTNELTCHRSKEIVCQPSTKRCACKKQACVCRPLGEEKTDMERLTPFETLWQSKGSLASSSDMDAVSRLSPVKNFEDKLEEANTLIEKVRETLKDIGKDMQHKTKEPRKTTEQQKPAEESKKEEEQPKASEHRRVSFVPPEETIKGCANVADCINMVCSIHGECCMKADEKQKDIGKEKEAKKKIEEESPKKVEKEQAKTQERNKKINSIEEVAEMIQVECEQTCCSQKGEKKKLSEDKTMDLLQNKLDVISESSLETDFKIEAEKQHKNISATSMEKASSPVEVEENYKQPDEPIIHSTGPEISSWVNNNESIRSDVAVTKINPLETTKDDHNEDESESKRDLLGTENKKKVIKKTSSGRVKKTCSTEKTGRSEVQCNSGICGAKQTSSGEVRESTSKSKKLSVQIMPPVNIRGGLVTQRTLNLCINPSGSIINENLASNMNVGYQEVKDETEAMKETEIKLDEISSQELFSKCPDDCRDRRYHCKYRVLESIFDAQRNNSDPGTSNCKKARLSKDFINALNKDALLLFKSYQIVDQNRSFQKSEDETSTNLANFAHNIVRKSIQTKNDKSVTVATDSFSEEHSCVISPNTTTDSAISEKTPWDIGFYQTKSTQVSSISLQVPPKAPEPFEPPEPPQQTTTVMAVQTSIIKRIQDEEEPVRDSPSVSSKGLQTSNIHKITGDVAANQALADIVTILKEGQDQEKQKIELDTSTEDASLVPTVNEMEDIIDHARVLSQEHCKKSASSSSISSSSESDKRDEDEVKTECEPRKKSSSSTSSSTSSSYNVHGSKHPSVSSDSRPRSETAEAARASWAVPKLNRKRDEQQVEVNEKDANKIDKNFQVSLPSSSESSKSSSHSSSSNSRERMNTITCFIKGLTGTSREELAKLRSNPSFPKTDLKEWSITQIKTVPAASSQSVSDKEDHVMSKRSMYEVTLEEIMDSHEYIDKLDETVTEQKLSARSNLSEKTKKKRLKEFKQMTEDSQNKNGDGEDKKNNSNVVMRVTEERQPRDCGEANKFSSFTKRQLPFYRRVLGRVVDSSMQTSHSEPIPLDESISEGEIKCKCSISIGEVHPAHNDKKISCVKYLKKHHDDSFRREFGDKSIRIARQRAHYNNWITYYLQKHQYVPPNDSSSTSPVHSSNK